MKQMNNQKFREILKMNVRIFTFFYVSLLKK